MVTHTADILEPNVHMRCPQNILIESLGIQSFFSGGKITEIFKTSSNLIKFIQFSLTFRKINKFTSEFNLFQSKAFRWKRQRKMYMIHNRSHDAPYQLLYEILTLYKLLKFISELSGILGGSMKTKNSTLVLGSKTYTCMQSGNKKHNSSSRTVGRWSLSQPQGEFESCYLLKKKKERKNYNKWCKNVEEFTNHNHVDSSSPMKQLLPDQRFQAFAKDPK